MEGRDDGTPDTRSNVPNTFGRRLLNSDGTASSNMNAIADKVLGRYGNPSDRRACSVAGRCVYVDIASALALLALHSTATVVGFTVAVSRMAPIFAITIDFHDPCFGGTPRWNLPRDAGEAFQIESLALPLATWLSGAVKGS